MTVFLVEDDLAVAALTATWLRALSFEVIVSNDGREAGALASRLTAPLDLLLTDVMLTGMRGPVLAGAVRSHHPEMAVLFTSGYSPELVGEIFASHIDTALLLHKPYTADQLASGVRLALARRAASSHPRPAAGHPEVAPDLIAARRT
jgi:two-component system cell cycle sensor histidine kinase/response regulator CckA